MALPGYICLAVMPGDKWYTGLVERSFSIGTDTRATQFFWTGTAHSILGAHDLDGWKNAKDRADKFEERHPGARVFIFDARGDGELPVTLEWEKWLLDSRPAYTLSGVADKYGARNIGFQIKTDRSMMA